MHDRIVVKAGIVGFDGDGVREQGLRATEVTDCARDRLSSQMVCLRHGAIHMWMLRCLNLDFVGFLHLESWFEGWEGFGGCIDLTTCLLQNLECFLVHLDLMLIGCLALLSRYEIIVVCVIIEDVG